MMFRAVLGSIMDNLSEIDHIAKSLYILEKRSILHVKATRIANLGLQTQEWALALASENEELEKRVKELEAELKKASK